MSIMRPIFILFVLFIGCQQVVGGVNESNAASNNSDASAEIKQDDQLMVNKNTLLTGATEELRIKAAILILKNDNPPARQFLFETLRQNDNSAARRAVCKAFIQMKLSGESINKEDEFIQPILDIFNSDNDSDAQLAAETTLLFNYVEIGESLENLASDSSKSIKTRLNAINALKLRSDMMATIRLIKLVDDTEKQVSSEAVRALSTLGISVGTDPNSRKQTIDELIKRGEVAYLRTRLKYQDSRIRDYRSQLDLWHKRYKDELNSRYNSLTEDKAKGEFLAKYLRDSEATIRVWALDKTYQWRNTPGTMGLPTELGPIFLTLISDKDKNIRLQTARLLAISVDVNSVTPLLSQLEIENDNQVKNELLVALGEACYVALPTPPTKIPDELAKAREKILEWAAKFLFIDDVEMARRGAEVLKKLLKRDGLKTEDVDKYLNSLAERYNTLDNDTNNTLKGQILSAMTGLCAQDCTYKDKAAQLFEPLFRQSLQEETDFIRELAVDGLIYIDKSKALSLFRNRNDLINDPSEKIRKKLIELADEVGNKEDLSWLSEKLNSNSESESSWQAMLKIFRNSDADTIKDWTKQLTSQSGRIKLTETRQIDYFRIAESKAENGDKPIIRKKLASIYKKISDFERASDYYNMLYQSAKTEQEKYEILPDLIDTYLRSSKIEPFIELVKTFLSEGDIDPNSILARSIDSYILNSNQGTDPNIVYEKLTEIETPQPRPLWKKWLELWAAQLNTAKETNNPKQVVN